MRHGTDYKFFNGFSSFFLFLLFLIDKEKNLYGGPTLLDLAEVLSFNCGCPLPQFEVFPPASASPVLLDTFGLLTHSILRTQFLPTASSSSFPRCNYLMQQLVISFLFFHVLHKRCALSLVNSLWHLLAHLTQKVFNKYW